MHDGKPITSSNCHCINLRRAANAVTDFYNSKLHAAGITLSQYSLLCNIHKIEPCSIADLARQVRLERTTLVRNLKVLYTADWIYDEANPGNRKSRIRLTQAGMDKIHAGKALWEQAQAQIEDCLGKETLYQLTDALLSLELLSVRQIP